MAKKASKKIEKIVKAFVQSLQEDIPVEKVFVFGSYANGTPTDDSDIDIIIVSPYFETGSHIKHMQYLFRKAAKISSLIEPIAVSPSEIKNADDRLFLGQILKKAKPCKF